MAQDGSISRRAFIAGAGALASGCTVNGMDYAQASICEPPGDGGPIRIDMHCHLMNIHDLSEGAFLARRFFDIEDDAAPTTEVIAIALARALGSLLSTGAWTIKREREVLRVEMTRAPDLTPAGTKRTARQSNRDFCFFAGRTQQGLLKAETIQPIYNAFFNAEAQNQATGIFSTRIRNAARMMTLFPQTDIFLPSMVDLYEGSKRFNYPLQIAFYSELALATRGRFLPLASFSPEREYDDRRKGRSPDNPEFPSQLYYLKYAIDQMGFVGVKLHPSSGFAPTDNLRWGCVNESGRRISESDAELYQRFTAYDAYLAELFAFCKERDVPVLTHNSTGISANLVCMRGGAPASHPLDRLPPATDAAGQPVPGTWTYPFRDPDRPGLHRRYRPGQEVAPGVADPRDESDWTNSPAAWAQAMEEADTANPALPGLKVILAHFANAFAVRPDAAGVARLHPSRWLMDAARLMRRQRNLYTDLSEVNEFFAPENAGAYGQVFRDLLGAEPALRRNIMYGSDWHMPNTALAGASYPGKVESILPDRIRPAVMGGTAAEVFGLRSGHQTRARLARFFDDPPLIDGTRRRPSINLPTTDIGWWDRL